MPSAPDILIVAEWDRATRSVMDGINASLPAQTSTRFRRLRDRRGDGAKSP